MFTYRAQPSNATSFVLYVLIEQRFHPSSIGDCNVGLLTTAKRSAEIRNRICRYVRQHAGKGVTPGHASGAGWVRTEDRFELISVVVWSTLVDLGVHHQTTIGVEGKNLAGVRRTLPVVPEGPRFQRIGN